LPHEHDQHHDAVAAHPDQVQGSPAFRPGPCITTSLAPHAEAVAMNFFLHRFISDGYWKYVPDRAFGQGQNGFLASAAKACGMAALNNVQNIPQGGACSRRMYAEALNLVNTALLDPHRTSADDVLIAVLMLSFYEVQATE
jgi:hypothetical protein